jgi:hypothetical protein
VVKIATFAKPENVITSFKFSIKLYKSTFKDFIYTNYKFKTVKIRL